MKLVQSEIFDKTFNINSVVLPSNKTILKYIKSDREGYSNLNDVERIINTYKVRELYIKYSFPIISDNFMKSIYNMVSSLEITRIVELACGIGWLSYWMIKYNIPVIESIDNKSWNHTVKYLPIVIKKDAVTYVKGKRHAGVQLYVLSWPYMDSLAIRIWRSMLPHQYLLYIGESSGGCTANDAFFDAIHEPNLVQDNWNMYQSFLSFDGIHDRPYLFRKL